MTFHHHLDDATVLRYASGDLDAAFTIVVASHLAMCESCRRSVRNAEAVGGQLLDTQQESQLAAGAFVRMMRQIQSAEGSIEHDDSAAPGSRSPVPAPLRRHIGDNFNGVAWRKIAPGVSKCHVALQSPGMSSLFLLRIDPGKAVPEHGHVGSEMTLVLSGAYRDEMGLFERGDIADLDDHVEHHPQVEPGGPCVCVVATEAPTRFKGIISRLLQPLFRI